MSHRYEKIVIGSCLNAALYSFTKKIPMVFTEHRPPFRFDFCDPDSDFSCLKIPNQTKTLSSFNGHKIVGVSKRTVWDRLLFLMSLDGLLPASNLLNSIRRQDSTIAGFSEYSKIIQIEFETAYYFGDNNAHNFVSEKILDNDRLMCYDWIAFNRGGKHNIDYFETKDEFVKNIWFYSSDRIDGNTPIKDACVVSEISRQQENEFDFSETMARFKLTHEMESRGMKGVFNGYTKNGTPRYYKFRTTSIARTKRSIENSYKPKSKNIKIPKINQKDLLKGLQNSCLGYDRFLKWPLKEPIYPA